MRNILSNIIIATLFLLFLNGCFDQYDEMHIGKDGKLSFVTEITITDKNNEFSFDDVYSTTESTIKDLQKSGWDVSNEVISKKRPYKIKVLCNGYINEVNEKTDFYEFIKIGEREYKIIFKEPEIAYKSNRSISIKKSSLYDLDGKEVNNIENVDSNKYYVAKFKNLKETSTEGVYSPTEETVKQEFDKYLQKRFSGCTEMIYFKTVKGEKTYKSGPYDWYRTYFKAAIKFTCDYKNNFMVSGFPNDQMGGSSGKWRKRQSSNSWDVLKGDVCEFDTWYLDLKKDGTIWTR